MDSWTVFKEIQPIRPADAGVGLRSIHMAQILEHRPDVGWLEVHPENYMGDQHALGLLEELSAHYPLSLHSVSLSLGSATPVDLRQLSRLKSLCERLRPALVSEHLAWSSIDGVHLNDLLPIPYTEEALDEMSRNIDRVQSCLGRQILIENPSSYLRFRHSTLSEGAFLAELVARTHCGLLLDINNLYISAHNVSINPTAFLDDLPAAAIQEFHVAGHTSNRAGPDVMLIDDHGSRVCEEVWNLYADAVRRFGPRPTLVEWDTDIPILDVLLAEAARAHGVMVSIRGDYHLTAA